MVAGPPIGQVYDAMILFEVGLGLGVWNTLEWCYLILILILLYFAKYHIETFIHECRSAKLIIRGAFTDPFSSRADVQ